MGTTPGTATTLRTPESPGPARPGIPAGAGRSLDRERSERLAYPDELVHRESTGFQPRPAGAASERVRARSADPAGVAPEPVPIRPDPSGTRPDGLPAPGEKPAEARADLTVELPFPASAQPGPSGQPAALGQPTVLEDPSPSADAEPPEAQGNGNLPDHHEVTVVPGVPRYHRSACILIRFMGDGDLQKMTVAAARDAGCTPCRACQPDGAEAD